MASNVDAGGVLRLKVVLSSVAHSTGGSNATPVGGGGNERRFLTTINGAATIGKLAAKIALELTELFTADAPLDACMLRVFNRP
jgi:hypothetical protein